MIGFTGFYDTPNNDFVVREFTGFQDEYPENLGVKVVDQFGLPVKNVTIRVTQDGALLDQVVLIDGEYFLWITAPSTIVAEVVDDDNYLAIGQPATINHDGVSEEARVLTARVRYKYRVKPSNAAEYSNEAQLRLTLM